MIIAGDLSPERAHDALMDYVSLALVRHGHYRMLGRIFELRNFTPYDATYVALTEQLDATLVTCDGRMTRAAQAVAGLNVVGVTG